MFHYEVKIKFSFLQIATIVVLILTLIVIMNAKKLSLPTLSSAAATTSSEKEEEIVEIDMVKSIQAAQIREGQKDTSKLMENWQGTVKTDIFVYQLTLKSKNKNKDLLEELFNSLTKSITPEKIPFIASAKSRSFTLGNEERGEEKSAVINYAALLGEDSSTDESQNIKNLRDKISNKYANFQRCYEKALLVDELLEGNATIKIRVGKSVETDFKGIGTTASIDGLKKCIESEGSAIQFAKEEQGKQIKFSLFLSL